MYQAAVFFGAIFFSKYEKWVLKGISCPGYSHFSKK
jgi:hypothetical protein